MFYYNDANQNLINELNSFQFDFDAIKNFLKEKGLNFAFIRNLEDGCLEFTRNDDYILLGPCGGVYKSGGKYSKYMAEEDTGVLEELSNDLRKTISDKLDIIYLE